MMIDIHPHLPIDIDQVHHVVPMSKIINLDQISAEVPIIIYPNHQIHYHVGESFLFEISRLNLGKCILRHDPNFRGCGFQLTQKHNCDTPVVLEIAPHSPAKRRYSIHSRHFL